MRVSTKSEYSRARTHIPDANLLACVRGGDQVLRQFEAVDDASVLLAEGQERRIWTLLVPDLNLTPSSSEGSIGRGQFDNRNRVACVQERGLRILVHVVDAQDASV